MKPASFFCCVLLGWLAPGRAGIVETRPPAEARVGKKVDAVGSVCLYRKSDDFCLIVCDRAEYHFTLFAPERRRGLRAPSPGFPAQIHPVPEGIGLYEFAFDACGDVAKVNVIQSANSALDHWTGRYAVDNWKGPPDSAITLAIAYHQTGEGTRVYGR